MTRATRVTRLVGAALLALAAPALAQQAPAGTGPMVVERVKNGFTAAPVVRFGAVDDQTRVLAGGEAGWVFDQRLLIGGAGFGLVNGGRDEVVGYGGGTATLPAEIGTLPVGRRPGNIRPGTRIFVRDDYAVFEPEVTVHIRLSDLLHVSAGAADPDDGQRGAARRPPERPGRQPGRPFRRLVGRAVSACRGRRP